MLFRSDPNQPISNPFFSEGNQFRSYLGKGHKRMKRINYYVDTHLKSESDVSKTTSYYKDTQREEVYKELKNISEITDLDPKVIQEVKRLFHLYRMERSRIHKLDWTMAVLFDIAFQKASKMGTGGEPSVDDWGVFKFKF